MQRGLSLHSIGPEGRKLQHCVPPRSLVSFLTRSGGQAACYCRRFQLGAPDVLQILCAVLPGSAVVVCRATLRTSSSQETPASRPLVSMLSAHTWAALCHGCLQRTSSSALATAASIISKARLCVDQLLCLWLLHTSMLSMMLSPSPPGPRPISAPTWPHGGLRG